MQQWILQIMSQFGYIGILLLIALENIFPPIPSEIILTFGGFMSTYTDLNIWGVILAATGGSVIGAIVLYGVGRIFKPERLENWLDGKLGRVLHFKKGDVSKASEWFNKRGKSTVFFCRFIPIVRSLISIPAGMAKMQMGLFLLFTATGSLIWNTVLVYLGVAAGASWKTIVKYMNTYSLVAALVLCAVALILGVIFIKKRFLDRNGK